MVSLMARGSQASFLEEEELTDTVDTKPERIRVWAGADAGAVSQKGNDHEC